MAPPGLNTTDPRARNVKGTDPQYLVEKITRMKIYETRFWKEHCFALSAETLVDKAVKLKACGGIFGGNGRPSDFMCLVLKMLQIQPDKDIIIEFIKNEEFKYVRMLGAFYLRLVGSAMDVFNYLEPLLNDYRKIRIRLTDGKHAITHCDEIIDSLLRNDHHFCIQLPTLTKRKVLEEARNLEPRRSALEDLDNLDEMLEREQEQLAIEAQKKEDAEREAERRKRQRDEETTRLQKEIDRLKNDGSDDDEEGAIAQKSSSSSSGLHPDREARGMRTRDTKHDTTDDSSRRGRDRDHDRDSTRHSRRERSRSPRRARSRDRDRRRRDDSRDRGSRRSRRSRSRSRQPSHRDREERPKSRSQSPDQQKSKKKERSAKERASRKAAKLFGK